MKQIQYNRYGGSEVMRLMNSSIATPGPGEIAVRVKAASVNPIDWKVREGNLKMVTGKIFPRLMGSDFSGIVEAVGSGVTRFKPGDSVFGLSRLKESGSFAEAVITNESFVAIKPDLLSFEQAACLPTAAVTSWNGLVDKAQLKSGQRIFINGCTGGVGQAAVQIARMFGAIVDGSCSVSSIPMARKLGVEHAFDYRKIDYSSLKESFDIVYDTSGTLPGSTGFSLLKKKGIFIDLHASPVKFLQAFFNKRLKLVICTPRPSILDEIAQAAVNGKIQMTIGESVSLKDAINLITDLEKGKKIGGKALIMMD